MIARTPNQEVDYVLKRERELPAEQQTIFRLRALSSSDRSQLNGFAAYDMNKAICYPNMGERRAATVRVGLVGWRNMRGADGSSVDYQATKRPVQLLGKNRVVMSEECLDFFAEEDLDEIETAILEVNTVTEAERKN